MAFCFSFFYDEKVSFVENYLLFYFSWQHLCTNFVIIAILDRRPRFDVGKI